MPTIHYMRRTDVAQLGIKLIQSRSTAPPGPRTNAENWSTNMKHDHNKQAEDNPAKQDGGPNHCATQPLSSTSSQYSSSSSIQEQRLTSDRNKDSKEKYHADAGAAPTLSLSQNDDELKHGGAELLYKKNNKTETSLKFITCIKHHEEDDHQGEQRRKEQEQKHQTHLIYVKIGNTEHPAFELFGDDAPAALTKDSNSVWVKWISNGKKECVFRHQIVPDGLQAQRKRKQPDYYHNQNSSTATNKKSNGNNKKNGCEERSRSRRSGGAEAEAGVGAGGGRQGR